MVFFLFLHEIQERYSVLSNVYFHWNGYIVRGGNSVNNVLFPFGKEGLHYKERFCSIQEQILSF